MTTAILEDAIEIAYSAIGNIEVALAEAQAPAVLKAIKGNDRFKNSSVWVQLSNGKYKHVQSGKITTAARLAGYTQAFVA